AIKWVVGEQSVKALRAERMDDVIFNGSESRKALNVAEITLVISQDGNELPLDVSEVAIRRRLYRSGESEYFVNNVAVRLREIRELFFDTGIGKTAYSIMEQGKIDQILSNKPEERRQVFEEAAGITKFRAKGLDAERKLDKTRENMRQVSGILGEVRRSYESLKTQARKTESYRELREKIFATELDIQLLRLRSLNERKNDLESDLKARQDRRDALRQDIESVRGSIERSIDEVNAMETSLVENQKKLYRLDLERQGKANQIKILSDRIHEVERQVSSGEERFRFLQRKLEQSTEDQGKHSESLHELEGMLREVEGNIDSFVRDIQQFEERITRNDGEVSSLIRQASDGEQRAESLRADLRRLTDDIVTELDQRLRELGYSAQERERAEASINSLLETLRIQLVGKQRLLEDVGSLQAVAPGEERKVVSSLQAFLAESLERLEALVRSFSEYRRSTPVFLEEFLAPEGIITRKRELDQAITETMEGVAKLRERAESLRGENNELNLRIGEYRHTLEELRVNRARMYTQRSALQGEIGRLQREIDEQQLQVQDSRKEIERSKQRLQEIQEQIDGLKTESAALEEQNRLVRTELSALEKEIRQQNSGLAQTEESLKGKTRTLDQLHGEIESRQVSLAEARAEIRNVYETFREMYSQELSEYESRMYEVSGQMKELRGRLAAEREALRALGQVNLMAPEEFAEVSERYRFLTGQIEDLSRASEDLKKVTEEIRTESAELFLESYGTIRKNFHLMFRRLFGGGRAELKLVDPDKVLESGIEIFAQPPGKKLESINLLSGGERTLTAIALLFAFYMVRPSPFCILDEIDAALDDQNISRFLHLLKEFASSSQFIIVTHNKKTIASADSLLGITMEESGISKIITLRLEHKVEEKTYA
ncbi:MAG: AAA family ATPase, partial [Spirochaetales bacterium]|nr:AAA family ATPase [Spirochaetales bacterium]